MGKAAEAALPRPSLYHGIAVSCYDTDKNVLEDGMDIVRIRPYIKDYDWGNEDFIPSLLGIPADGRPKAEVWFGTHPAGKSTVISEQVEVPLGAFLADHADGYFGPAHLEQFGPSLPLLLKVLAIEKPLSIQVHPSAAQAEKGFTQEEPLHHVLPREQWNYQDRNRKAEVIYALTPITAMCGFRSFDQVDATLRMLIPTCYDMYFAKPVSLAGEDANGKLSCLFETLYTMDPATLKTCIDEYIGSLKHHAELPLATADGRFLEPKGIALSCATEYPKDPGLFCPFLLNVLHLEPGEALFLEPRTIHAYVFGNGIELMSASDNVLRGGLTHKKVDVPELMRVMKIEADDPAVCPTLIDAFGRKAVLTPTEEFMLLTMDSGYYDIERHSKIELMLCTEGSASIITRNERFELKKGECCVIAATIPSYRLEVQGTVFSATVPA